MQTIRSITSKRAIFSRQFPIIMTLLFAAVAGIGMSNHEMWRDEFEIFMKLRDAPTFFDLFPNVQPFPSPYLTFLYFVVKLLPSPAGFQIFHLLTITLAVFIFNKYSPFHNHQKILFNFSYFILFEYGIISREYSMLLLLLFLSIFLITRRERNFLLIALSLLFLANHHLYGLLISFSLLIYIGFHITDWIGELTVKRKRQLLLLGVLLFIGVLCIIPQYVLLARFNRYSGMFGQAPFFMTVRSIWNAFFPVPHTSGIHFWNTNLFAFPLLYSKSAVASEFISAGNILTAGVSILILLLGIMIFSGTIPVMMVFLINTALQVMFLQYLSVFYIRYQGLLFIIFIYSYWLFLHAKGKRTYSKLNRLSVFSGEVSFVVDKLASSFVTGILFVQFCVGLFSYVQDLRYPFTASYEAAKYIKEKQLDKNVMVGYVDYAAQAISGHLGEKIYYPQTGIFQTYVDWLNKNRREIMPLNEVLDRAIIVHLKYKRNVLLILNFPLVDLQKHPVRQMPIVDNIGLKYVNSFRQTIVEDEAYFLYLIYSDL